MFDTFVGKQVRTINLSLKIYSMPLESILKAESIILKRATEHVKINSIPLESILATLEVKPHIH